MGGRRIGRNILNLSLGQDTGGQQGRLMAAWERYRPEERYISVTSKYTFYPIRHKLDHNTLARKWWPEADVVHINNDLRHIERLKYRGRLPRKPMLVHHHGTMFRTRPDYHLQALAEYRAVAACSTVDLHAIAPEQTVWLPQAYDLDELQGYRYQALEVEGVEGSGWGHVTVLEEPDRPFRIAHAPTDRAIKSTDALIVAVDKLRSLGVKVELDIIEKVSNADCLKRKARADVFVDQLLLGYGCNAIEAWGMGIPVIAGVQPEKCGQAIRMEIPEETPYLMEELWGGFPFLSATEETLFRALSKMLNPAIRRLWADKGMAHFLRFHHAPVVVEKLSALYTEAENRYGG